MKAFLLATSKINDWPYNKNLEQNNSSKIQIVSFVHFLWLLYFVAPRRISSMRKWMKKVQNEYFFLLATNKVTGAIAERKWKDE